MKKLLTSFVATGVGQPITKYTLDHLQQAYTEAINALALFTGINTSAYTVLYGCVNSGTYPVFTISAGAIFFNGEIYLVDAVTFNAGANTAVASLSTTYIAQDPLLFSDSSSHNVHQIKKIVFATGVSGSGLVDFNNLHVYNKWKTYDLTGHFTPTGTTITVTGTAGFRYKKMGNQLHFKISLNLTTAAATLTYLECDLAAIFTSVSGFFGHIGTAICLENGAVRTVVNASGGSILTIAPIVSGANISSTTNVTIQGEGTIEIIPS